MKQQGEKTKVGSEQLIGDLEGLAGFSDVSIKVLLDQHSKPLPRSLVLFFSRDSLDELLELDRSTLDPQDVALAAILFGISSGWLVLPKELKMYAGLNTAASSLMASMNQAQSESSLSLELNPLLPASIRELLRGSQWNKKQQDAALNIAKELGWNCVKTRIRLSKGEYTLDVSGSGLEILLDGEVKAVTTEVTSEEFWKYMGELKMLPIEVENNARKVLEASR